MNHELTRSRVRRRNGFARVEKHQRQPSPTGTYRAMPESLARISFGPLGATSKVLGNY